MRLLVPGWALTACLSLSGVGAAAAPPSALEGAAAQQVRSLVTLWPLGSRLATARMMERYGSPDAFSELAVTWNDKGPWDWIIVYKDAKDEAGVLQQFVRYEVPHSRWRALAAFDHGVAYDPATKQLSVRSDSEEKNILILNLADEVVRGKKDASAARGFYDKTLVLFASGKSSRYMRKLLFRPKIGSRSPARGRPGSNPGGRGR